MAHRFRSLARWRAIAILALAASTVAVGLSIGTANAQTLTINEPGTLTAEVGNKFCVNLDIDGASDPANLSFTVTPPGSLPADLDFDQYTFGAVAPATEARNAIVGTPTVGGSETFVVEVTDSLGNGDPADDVTATATMNIDVVDLNEDPAAVDAVIAAGRDPRGYTIDCDSQAREVQGLLRDLNNFGPGGTVGQRIAIEDMVDTLDADHLADIDILVDGFVFDEDPDLDPPLLPPAAFDPTEIADIKAWVEAGGVLIAAEDGPTADALADAFDTFSGGSILCNHTPSELGDPTTDCPTFGSASATHPVVNGPFGDWSALPLNTSGTVGHFDANPGVGVADPDGWFVIARNGGGQPTVISRRAEAGRVILISDEGLLRTESYGGSNETFVANLFAYALNAFDAPDLVGDTVAGTTGDALSVDLCANDTSTGDPVIDVTISAGTLPIGLELVGCSVTGTPTTPGDSTATYQVVDGDGDVDTATINFSIEQGGPLPRCRGEEATIIGTRGPDVLRGTPDVDVIVARGGDDVIRGRGSNDIICGGRGDDTIRGNRGADVIIGQAGNDTLLGQRGADILVGRRGNDVARGGGGNDVVRGNAGNDRLAGNRGPRDRCIGGSGTDVFLNGCEIERQGRGRS